MRDLAADILSGYLGEEQIIFATNGEEGVQVFNKHKEEIGIILMDVIMPKMGGIEAINQIKQINGQTPILLLSGYNDDPEVEELAEQDNISFTRKPYSTDDFVLQIITLLKKC